MPRSCWKDMKFLDDFKLLSVDPAPSEEERTEIEDRLEVQCEPARCPGVAIVVGSVHIGLVSFTGRKLFIGYAPVINGIEVSLDE
jgi:hypothetical protein